MTSTPLGIDDIQNHDGCLAECHPDHWYWCRRHERAEHVSLGTDCNCSTSMLRHAHNGILHFDTCPRYPEGDPCIRVGPFMSEREAKRLSTGFERYESGTSIESGHVLGPLGMEVEQ